MLVEVVRGDLVESVHRGSVAVVDADGALVISLGDIRTPRFPRSTIKTVQALVAAERGVYEKFSFSDEDIALSAASHSGEIGHVEAVEGILRRAGVANSCLECGAHLPMSEAAALSLAAHGLKPGAVAS